RGGRRAARAGRRAPHQHRRGRPVEQPPGHARHLPGHRGGAPAPRRGRPAPGARLPDRAGPRDRGRPGRAPLRSHPRPGARLSPERPMSIEPADLLAIKTIGDVQLSPDGARVAYTLVEINAEADEYQSAIWVVP